jgi:DNA-binding NarL/FixJ family response regulator
LQAGLRLVARLGSACRVLIVTDDDSEVSIRRAVKLGARGYLLLTSRGEAVERAVRRIHAGGTALDPVAMTKIAVSLASPSLTGKEMEVLCLIMNGLPDKVIARTLKQSVGTAKGHVKSILSKLDVGSRAAAIVVARRRGLVSDEALAMPLPECAHPVAPSSSTRSLGESRLLHLQSMD